MVLRDLGACLDIVQGDVISVVGAGGKTSLIMYLAEYLKGRKVVSASTKMYKPDRNWPSYIDEPYLWSGDNEVIIAAKRTIDQKISDINPFTKEAGYDYWLIEADGSRGLPLKGWGPEEPVIIDETSVTIGIVDMTTLGMPVSVQTIFRPEAFKAMTSVKDKITIRNLEDIIVHKDGLFKKSKGRRILLINKVEERETMFQAEQLCESLAKSYTEHGIESIVNGSIRKKKGYLKGII
jgi:probable selenium-dependent hydroxylase accessory protein YqeC